MSSVNKVILIGNLGKDPEIRHIGEGVAVANFSLATSETYKDRNTGEKREQTEWHNIVLWRGLAEVAEKYLNKGSKIFIEGRLRTRSYEDKEGQTRYMTEVVGDNMVMLGGKRDGDGRDNSAYDQEPVRKGDYQKASNSSAADAEGPGMEDDLPF